MNEALLSENAISLKKVEKFIAEGEKLPFNYSKVTLVCFYQSFKTVIQELMLLRERRTLAKAWLDKLKKSFLKTSRSTRKTGGDSEKLSLEEMREMVTEGSLLYDNSNQNKDLKKASEVVKEADGVLLVAFIYKQ